jgi:SAM-dependent methyltransferase
VSTGPSECDTARLRGLTSPAVTPPGGQDQLEGLLAEQVAYYRALATEYQDHWLDLPGGEELIAALDAFRPTGDVLEIACGPGSWTPALLRHAASVTAVDAAPEMLAIASAQIADERVRFVNADIFRWRPDRRYDVVFFGFWLSHVPGERFEALWSLVGECLAPRKAPAPRGTSTLCPRSHARHRCRVGGHRTPARACRRRASPRERDLFDTTRSPARPESAPAKLSAASRSMRPPTG